MIGAPCGVLGIGMLTWVFGVGLVLMFSIGANPDRGSSGGLLSISSFISKVIVEMLVFRLYLDCLLA